MTSKPTEAQWTAALTLLTEAENEINTCDSLAQGSHWYGNELAERIGEFLKSLAVEQEGDSP
jgi:hypothetical protein